MHAFMGALDISDSEVVFLVVVCALALAIVLPQLVAVFKATKEKDD